MHFLQSSEWENFQKKVGRKTFRTESGALIVMYPLYAGMRYAYVGGAEFREAAVMQVKKIALRERAIFLKWESMEEQNERTIFLMKNASFNQAPRALQPQQTICIDLAQDEQAILGAMHHKTRYNIGLAQRHRVRIAFYARPASGQKDILWSMLEETAARDGFHLHEKNYYFDLCGIPGIEIATAEIDSRIAAAHLILFFADKAIYLHGGSSYSQRFFMAPFLLHWAVMQEAKKRGCAFYDFWGIDEKKWPGLTRFKEGFGGRRIQYAGSWDYVFLKPLYMLYRFRQKMR